MSDWDHESCCNNENYRSGDFEEEVSKEQDWLMEQILENVNSTPLGQVLQAIAFLPEVRQEKVLNIRRQITNGDYDLNDRLELAIDKVIEDIVT